MVRVMSKASPWEREGWGTQNDKGEWVITRLGSVGETVRESVKKEEQDRFSYELPQGSLKSLKDYLMKGWERWDGYQLTEPEVDDFLDGKNEEAEKAAALLLAFAMNTDPMNIFSSFLT